MDAGSKGSWNPPIEEAATRGYGEVPPSIWRDRLARVPGDHLPLALLTGSYVGAGFLVRATAGLEVTRQSGGESLLMGFVLAAMVVFLLAACLVVTFFVSRGLQKLSAATVGSPPLRSRWADYRRHLALERLCGVFLVFFLYVQLMNAFVGFKGEIPEIQPFVWDETFMRLDRTLHGGHHPWVLLHGMVGTPARTMLLDRLYYLWFPVNLIFLIAMAWRPIDRVRGQFFLAYFGLWILLGTVMALAFSSAGPCYYGRVVSGPDPFAPLMRYLHTVDGIHPLTALKVQEMLWAGYLGKEQLIEGIAAMPSLHVSVPILFAIAVWRIDHRLGIAFWVYALLILLGSVHLGWHYAIDGYAALPLVPLVWWFFGRIYQAQVDGDANPGSPSLPRFGTP